MEIDSQRIARERNFHNKRFETPGIQRRDQAKYYWAVAEGWDDYIRTYRTFASGKDVLEYGCGDSKSFLSLAPLVKTLQAIDISDNAIARLKAENEASNVELHVMDAMNMTFADESFDLVFGSGIIHHLDTETAAREVARVLRPGGRAVFWEPLGLNPLINAYRRLTPDVRTPDEHPLRPKDFNIISRYFSTVECRHYGLATLGAVPFKGRKRADHSLEIMRRIDKVLFKIPGVRNLAWFALVDITK